MARKKKTDSMIKAVPLPESGTNMKDTWNPAELNEETKTKDTWNPAVINEEFKRFDSWNPAELNSYLTNKYNLEAVHDADIDNDTAHFVTLEPSTIQEIDYDIDQETGTSSQAILQSATMPVPGNNSPYVYRPNPTDSTGRNFCYQTELIGGSVVWNQLVNANNRNFTLTPSGSDTYSYKIFGINTYKDNVYLFHFKAKYNGTTELTSVYIQLHYSPAQYAIYANNTPYLADLNSGKTVDLWYFGKPTKDWSGMRIGHSSNSTLLTTDTLDITDMQIFNVTQDFQSTIANYIYTLEQSQSGSGVAWFRKYFPEVYYAYSAPTIQSTKVSGKKVVGFNQWDEVWEVGGLSSSGTNSGNTDRIRSKNYIPILPNFTYYVKAPEAFSRACWYDENKTLISSFSYVNTTYTPPTNARYMRFATTANYGSTYKNDICINISSSRNGEYEPYHLTTYDLSGSHLVKRNYEYRAYASGDESLPDTITDGTNTVTKRTTPITETVTNPTLYGIWKLDANNNLYFDGDSVEDIPNVQVIETGGTQEYVDAEVEAETRDVSIPAGGQEYYLNNITVVTVPDPPDTLTSASISIDNEGIVTITDNSGEEPVTYTTSITMPDTLLGDNYMVVTPGIITGVKYTRIQPKIRRTKK